MVETLEEQARYIARRLGEEFAAVALPRALTLQEIEEIVAEVRDYGLFLLAETE